MNKESIHSPAPGERAEQIEFRVLGPIEALRDGRPVALGGPRQQALLALLLLEPGRTVVLDRLIDELWATEPPDQSATTIRSYVSRLRAALGDDAPIHWTSAGYSIDVDPARIDAVSFERLIRAAEDDEQRGSLRRASDRLREALGLWRGRPFGALSDDGALRVEADRLEELRMHALEERLEADVRQGRSAEIVDEIGALCRQHPYRERLWRLLMLALYHSGRQADALDAYQQARQILDEQLGLEPSAELEALQVAVLRHEVPPVTPLEHRYNLPAPLTSFIGRESELAEIGALLDEARLITLTGVGGVGKTRLALEAGQRALDRFVDGVFVVDLSPLSDPGLVASHVAHALDVRERPDTEIGSVVLERLVDADLLLIVDNCEHLRDAVARFVGQLLTSSPRLRILATSREPLGVPGELDYTVPPLGLPSADAPLEVLRRSESVTLLFDRARSARPRLRDDADLIREAAQICRDLDGLPLAIELAAARAKSLSLKEIAERLNDRFRFLVSWRRLTPARHQTLEQVIGWSFELLGRAERELLIRLSIFAGGFRLESAVDVCMDGDSSDAVDRVGRLVDASLLVAEPGRAETRYRLLETVRAYAAERLDDDTATEMRQRHAAHFLAFAEAAAQRFTGEDQTRLFDAFEAEHDNLRAALEFIYVSADADKLLRLSVALTRFWYVRAHFLEARRWLERALEISDGQAPTLRRRAFTAAASIALIQGDYARAIALAEASLAIAQEMGEPRLVANGLSNLGAIVLAAGDEARARELLERAVSEAQAGGDDRVLALATNNLADHALTVGDYVRAEPLFEQSLSLLRKLGDTSNVARSLFNLGSVALELGRLDDAARRFEESLEHSNQAGDKEDLAWCFLGLAALAVGHGDGERAAVLAGAAVRLLDEIGAAFKPYERRLHGETISRSRTIIGNDAFEMLRQRGADMSLDDAVRVARQRARATVGA